MSSNRPAARARRTSYDGRAAAPRVCSIETTRFCNLRCTMCIQYLTGATTRGPHMSLDAFREIAAKVFPSVRVWQPSVAGEPTLTKSFEAMLAIAAEHGVQLDLTTNGTLWNDRLRDAVAPVLHLVQFSFDSCDPGVFESIRRGASFTTVVANIRALRARCVALRGDRMPKFGLSVTLMRENVDGLPALVDFAAEVLQVDHLQVLHVFPITDDVRARSLVHDVELARTRIAEAAERARRRGCGLTVHPLDDVTAITALDASTPRAIATEPAPPPRVAGVVVPGVDSRRTGPVEPSAAAAVEPSAELPEAIGYCPFLWDRCYVQTGGDVLPCCVPGAPVVGSIWDGDLDAVWNGPLYRELRRRVVAQDPAPVCRGCRGYGITRDRQRIAEVLGGAGVPDQGEIGPSPATLDPRSRVVAAGRASRPPMLRWQPPVDPTQVVLECSTDRFVTLVFSTAWHGIAVEPDRWQVPAELWRLAPRERTLFWRLVSNADPDATPLAAGRIGPEGEPLATEPRVCRGA